ncbi:hypothetical protein A0H81_14801 [Grifola frondosa]|uniref:Uncharacterized protein n=1 Tax=Grifola frondosa TaxID=5627 RepID=A0A1C7LR09_GRIFR|nr:hypothetical protein A0H81_14801 [Grifola frondosa]
MNRRQWCSGAGSEELCEVFANKTSYGRKELQPEAAEQHFGDFGDTTECAGTADVTAAAAAASTGHSAAAVPGAVCQWRISFAIASAPCAHANANAVWALFAHKWLGTGKLSAAAGRDLDYFVVGFPDDMQEREFQNMFTFSAGLEAATLKIPNNEFTSYGAPRAPAGPNTHPSGLGLPLVR